MGKDNLYHKRKVRQARELERKKASRAPYDRIFIVCEGEKTEPNYFKGLRNELRLNKANVVIDDKKKGLDPKRLLDHTLEELKKDPEFNHIFCVFDKDKHATYNSTLERISKLHPRGGGVIHAITSVPCFEIWLLLHFVYTTKSYGTPFQGSSADLVIADLKKYLPDYEKGARDIFIHVLSRIEDAIKNAKQLTKFNETSGTDDPSTKVHLLVEYLQELGSSK